QRIVHHAFRLWLWWMVCLRLCRVSWIDGERRAGSGPRLVGANDTTLSGRILLLARLSPGAVRVETPGRSELSVRVRVCHTRAPATRAAHCPWPPDDSPRICRRSTSRGSAPMRSIHDAARSVQGRNLQALA